ncbi:MAG: sortase [Anaerolineales bacterium]
MAGIKEKPIQKQNGWQNRLRKPLSFLMILTGLALLPVVGLRIIEDVHLYNSPFDQIDYSLENQQGFLPMLEPAVVQSQLNEQPEQAPEVQPEPSLEDSAAPTLEAFPAPPDAALPDLEANPGLTPEHLLIPAINLFVPVVSAEFRYIDFEGKTYVQWEAPRGYVPGWQTDSAGLGVPGNTVLYGHHNIAGKVFENLYRLQVGQVIQMKSGDELFTYRVVLSMILEEKYQPLEVRLENARWILPSTDERITLITCWPERGNSHRVVVVAVREEPEAAIPVTGAEETSVSADETLPATQTSEPVFDPMRFAPPVEGSPEILGSSAPDVAADTGLVPERILAPLLVSFIPWRP